MVKVIPHISVPNARKTIETYKELFDATLIDHMPFDPQMGKQMGLPDSFDYENSTMHAVVEVGGATLFIADSMGGEAGAGRVEIVLDLDSREQIESIWGRVKAKGYRVVMELQEQFWGAIYGRFIDPDGVGWQLNYNIDEA